MRKEESCAFLLYDGTILVPIYRECNFFFKPLELEVKLLFYMLLDVLLSPNRSRIQAGF